MRYYQQNGIYIVEVSIKDFAIVMCDERKKSAAAENYCNAGFFANYNEHGVPFTLPAGHLICNFQVSNKDVKKYCQERGEFLNNTKFQFDSGNWAYANQFYQRALSTLIISNNTASIVDLNKLPKNLEYAIAGVPIMRNGEDIKFDTYVKNQGWDGSTLYATWHVFIGLKYDKHIYVMGMKTSSSNMIKSAEAYKKFKKLGMVDVIKLDGGGSFIFNVNGRVVASTSGNRRINSIITFGHNKSNEYIDINPYQVPKRTLVRGCSGNDVKWLQFELNNVGFGNVSGFSIDGSFGPATVTAVKSFQAANGLVADGSVGPATRSALLSF